jgi:hypothetical protein
MSANEAVSVASLDAFVQIAGPALWARRMAAIARNVKPGQRSGRALVQRHAFEITLERLRRRPEAAPTLAELRLAALAAQGAAAYRRLSTPCRQRMRAAVRAALAGGGTLVPLFHLLRVAAMQRHRGFEVRFAAWEDESCFDLLLTREGMRAEVACDVVSAEAGRDVHRGAWVRLLDRIDPDLHTWLASHPGRYLLKLTLPQGLRSDGQDGLAALHQRIRVLLESQRRADHDEAAVLRLDPLMLAASQADENGLSENGLMSSLRREFGHEAHLGVTASGGGVFVLAARAGRENEVAVAIRRRMAEVAPERLTGTRPGILAMFVEDTDRIEWRHLRERLEIEGETRQFLTNPEARGVVAVTCASRQELLGAPEPHAAPDGELRFRNPAHPAARAAALAPAVLSSP